MVKIDSINKLIKNNLNINGGKGMPKKLTIEELGQYIQKNIRYILNDSQKETFELPKFQHNYIDSLSLKLTESDNQKSLLLAAKVKEKPEIALTLSTGNYEKILSDIDRYDFPENFSKKVDALNNTFMYV